MPANSNLRGIVAMIFAMGALIGSDSCTKLVLPDLPLLQIVLMRGIASVSICAVLLIGLGLGRDLPGMFNPWVMARGVCEVVANVSFTLAILHMAIADVTAIAQTCPLLVLVGARLVFGELLGSSRLFMIALGISGALLVAKPGATAASPFAVLGFLTALAAAARDLMTRKVPVGIPAPVVAFAVLVALMVAGAIGTAAFETPVVPAPRHILLMLLSGGLLVFGHISIFLAFKLGSARSVAPFMYSLTLWSVLAGVVVFNDVPDLLSIVGMGLVALAGLLVISVDSRQRWSKVEDAGVS